MASLQASTYSLQFLYKIEQLKVASAVCEEERQPSPRAGGTPGKCIPHPPTVAPTTTTARTAAPTTVLRSLPNLNGERHPVRSGKNMALMSKQEDSTVMLKDKVLRSVELF